MFGLELSAAFLGLASAACWGSGDFCGGFATRRNPVFSVTIISQIIGIPLLLILVPGTSESFPPLADIGWGMLAGWAGGMGLIVFYRGLAEGHMGVVAPVTGIVTAAIPVLFGTFLEGLPGGRQLAGFVLAMGAVWMISRNGDKGSFQIRDLRVALLAGLGFGVFFILVDRMSETSVLWPLAVARFASISALTLTALLLKQRIVIPTHLPLVALSGILDMGGNVFFALATRAGRLDAASVLASLYPAGTVLLAWILIKERISPRQWIGVAAAVLAVVLISA